MLIHLIRHGEVANPAHVVYADLPGFVLSEAGRRQAIAAGRRLEAGAQLIVSSPLDRAVETAHLIAAESGADVVTDSRLTEWSLGFRWRGARWSDLPVVFPGELEAYLNDPHHLPFSPESLDEVADRISAAVADWTGSAGGNLAFVSHQDPIHAADRRLAGAAQTRFHDGKPAHCSITSLSRNEGGWSRKSRWAPPQ